MPIGKSTLAQDMGLYGLYGRMVITYHVNPYVVAPTAFLLGAAPWSGQALLAVGLPFLFWGWLLFFTSTWQMTRPEEAEESEQQARRMPNFSRPPWLSRPSWPSRPGRMRSR